MKYLILILLTSCAKMATVTAYKCNSNDSTIHKVKPKGKLCLIQFEGDTTWYLEHNRKVIDSNICDFKVKK